MQGKSEAVFRSLLNTKSMRCKDDKPSALLDDPVCLELLLGRSDSFRFLSLPTSDLSGKCSCLVEKTFLMVRRHLI